MNYDEEMKKLLDHFEKDVLPKIDASVMSIIITPKSKVDVKLCLELGASILLEKPLIIISVPGAQVPSKLRQLASAVIEGDIDDIGFQDRLTAAMNKVIEEKRRGVV